MESSRQRQQIATKQKRNMCSVGGTMGETLCCKDTELLLQVNQILQLLVTGYGLQRKKREEFLL